ncbi:MAG: type I secretion C-terminal target domain-containing protein [Phycisphaerales bacterium]|nr:type I secretion C-terminal target domain-containing protein [Phycisphaerales bacterium]
MSNTSALLLAADAGTRLYFQPSANYNGTLADGITFRAWDQSSGTAGSKVSTATNGGTTAFSSATDTASITVNAVNDAPAGTDKTVNLVEDVSYVFTVADFGFSDIDGNNFAGVVVDTLPSGTAGTLRLGDATFAAGTFVTADEIAAGMLTWAPVDNVIGATGSTSFTFSVRDDGPTGGANVNTDPTPNTITLSMSATNYTDGTYTGGVNLGIGSGYGNISIQQTDGGTETINVSTSSGTVFTDLNFFRSDNNLEITLATSTGSRVVTVINQFDGGTPFWENFTTSDGATYAEYSLGSGNYTLLTDTTGDASNNVVAGSAASEALTGGGGHDLLFGNGGNDTLTGGTGDDLLVGGLGVDRFVWLAGDQAGGSNVTTTYNFVGVTQSTNDHYAFYFEVDPSSTLTSFSQLTAIREGNPNFNGLTEASNTNYDALESSNNTRWTTADPGDGDHTVFWAQFDIAEAPGSIVQLDLLVEGYQAGFPGSSEQAHFGIWNYATSAWEELEATRATSDNQYNGTITASIADYLDDATNQVTIALFNEDNSQSLYIDYVEVQVQTPGPAVDSVQGFQSGAGGDVLDLDGLLPGGLSNATPVATLDDYIRFVYGGGNTTVNVDHDGGVSFASTMQIVLVGVDLTAGGTLTDQQVLTNLIADGNLFV